MFKKKEEVKRGKFYFGIWDDGSEILLTTNCKTLKKFQEGGVKKDTYKYYEFDPSKMTEVDLELIAKLAN